LLRWWAVAFAFAFGSNLAELWAMGVVVYTLWGEFKRKANQEG
jgi:hypothetical protein